MGQFPNFLDLKYEISLKDVFNKDQKRFKVGLLVVATGKYIDFIKPLIESADKYFCTNHDVTYYIFTDREPPKHPKIVKISAPHKKWPYTTLTRFHEYYKGRDQIASMDYLYACDADMLFVDNVANEILGERVGTLHPGFLDKRGSYEIDNPDSPAYVKNEEGTHYFAGGFYGGRTPEVLKLLKTVTENVNKDLANDFIAVWHDESHLNRYFIDNQPTVILNPSYCCPETLHPWFSEEVKSLPKKLIALDKDHDYIRE